MYCRDGCRIMAGHCPNATPLKDLYICGINIAFSTCYNLTAKILSCSSLSVSEVYSNQEIEAPNYPLNSLETPVQGIFLSQL
jgi:hypothetical protein